MSSFKGIAANGKGTTVEVEVEVEVEYFTVSLVTSVLLLAHLLMIITVSCALGLNSKLGTAFNASPVLSKTSLEK